MAGIVAAVRVALPLLIDADDPIAHALEASASELTGAVAASLASGAELRRTVDEDLLDRPMTAPVRQTWISLVKLADARTRAYTAVSTAQADEISLDDVALRGVEMAGESLEHVSQAMVDEG